MNEQKECQCHCHKGFGIGRLRFCEHCRPEPAPAQSWSKKIEEFSRLNGVYELLWEDIKPLFDEYAATQKAQWQAAVVGEIEKMKKIVGEPYRCSCMRCGYHESVIRSEAFTDVISSITKDS